MIELSLSRYKKARLWLDELPDFHYQVAEILTTTLPTQNTALQNRKAAALEFFVPAGPRANYGLLGAAWHPGLRNDLLVEVGIHSSGTLVSWALASSMDQVREGLPSEYAHAVLNSIHNNSSALQLGAGTLSIGCAAHAEAGSSPMFFRHLSRLLIDLLLLKPDASHRQEQSIKAYLEHWNEL